MMINQVKSIEEADGASIESVENVYWTSMRESLEALEKNEHFIRVIKEGYFKDRAVNGVSLLATDYVRQNGLRPTVMEQLVGISQLEDYFGTIKSLGAEVEDFEDEETTEE